MTGRNQNMSAPPIDLNKPNYLILDLVCVGNLANIRVDRPQQIVKTLERLFEIKLENDNLHIYYKRKMTAHNLFAAVTNDATGESESIHQDKFQSFDEAKKTVLRPYLHGFANLYLSNSGIILELEWDDTDTNKPKIHALYAYQIASKDSESTDLIKIELSDLKLDNHKPNAPIDAKDLATSFAYILSRKLFPMLNFENDFPDKALYKIKRILNPEKVATVQVANAKMPKGSEEVLYSFFRAKDDLYSLDNKLDQLSGKFNNLINELQEYQKNRSGKGDKLLSIYTEKDKIAAVEALTNTLSSKTPLDNKHMGALRDGELGKIIRKFVKQNDNKASVRSFLSKYLKRDNEDSNIPRNKK